MRGVWQAATDEEEEESDEEDDVVDAVRSHPMFERYCESIFGGIDKAFDRCVSSHFNVDDASPSIACLLACLLA